MTHQDAVRIARGGEGAIVAALLRLDGQLRTANEHNAYLHLQVDEICRLQVEKFAPEAANVTETTSVIWDGAATGSALPEWLRDDASFLVCSKCRRKSYAATVINATCEMSQPSGKACDGIMQGQNKDKFNKETSREAEKE